MTELIELARRDEKRNIETVRINVNTIVSHLKWKRQLKENLA